MARSALRLRATPHDFRRGKSATVRHHGGLGKKRRTHILDTRTPGPRRRLRTETLRDLRMRSVTAVRPHCGWTAPGCDTPLPHYGRRPTPSESCLFFPSGLPSPVLVRPIPLRASPCVSLTPSKSTEPLGRRVRGTSPSDGGPRTEAQTTHAGWDRGVDEVSRIGGPPRPSGDALRDARADGHGTSGPPRTPGDVGWAPDGGSGRVTSGR